mmetsp:Transcript_14210/g.43077  ORF Transcript_14210/g.43077 Transcript_14210/m.43077 type:complete len:280 (+) Transcript_14210:167-1006(+)
MSRTRLSWRRCVTCSWHPMAPSSSQSSCTSWAQPPTAPPRAQPAPAASSHSPPSPSIAALSSPRAASAQPSTWPTDPAVTLGTRPVHPHALQTRTRPRPRPTAGRLARLRGPSRAWPSPPTPRSCQGLAALSRRSRTWCGLSSASWMWRSTSWSSLKRAWRSPISPLPPSRCKNACSQREPGGAFCSSSPRTTPRCAALPWSVWPTSAQRTSPSSSSPPTSRRISRFSWACARATTCRASARRQAHWPPLRLCQRWLPPCSTKRFGATRSTRFPAFCCP